MGYFDGSSTNFGMLRDQFEADVITEAGNVYSNPKYTENSDEGFFKSVSDVITKGLWLTGKSAVQQLVNGADYAVNWVSNGGDGTGYQELLGDDWMAGDNYDDYEYYQKHKAGIDLAGTAISSIVPGLGAVKGLGLAAKGLATISPRMAGLSGLLEGATQAKYLNKAADAIASGGEFAKDAWKFRAQAGLASFGKNTLQGIAAEVGANAALAPYMPNADGKSMVSRAEDIITSSIAFGGLAGIYRGTIGYKSKDFLRTLADGTTGGTTSLFKVTKSTYGDVTKAGHVAVPVSQAGKLSKDSVEALLATEGKRAGGALDKLRDTTSRETAGSALLDVLRTKSALKKSANATDNYTITTIKNDANQQIDNVISRRVSEVADTAANAVHITNMVNTLDSDVLATILVGAKRMGNATNPTSTLTKYVNMQTGELHDTMIPSIYDRYNTVLFTGKGRANVDGELLQLSSSLDAAPMINQAYIQDLTAQMKATKFADLAPASNFQESLAQLRAFGKIKLEGDTWADSSPQIVEILGKGAKEEVAKMRAVDPKISIIEASTRLDVHPDVLRSKYITKPLSEHYAPLNTEKKYMQIEYTDMHTNEELVKAVAVRDLEHAAVRLADKQISQWLTDNKIVFGKLDMAEHNAANNAYSSLFGSASAEYGSTAEMVANIGRQYAHFMTEAVKYYTDEAMGGIATKIAHNVNKDAILAETGIIVHLAQASDSRIPLILTETGVIKRVFDEAGNISELAEIPFKHAETGELLHKFMGEWALEQQKDDVLRAYTGRKLLGNIDRTALYVPPPRPDEVKYKMFVKAENGDSIGMIYSDTPHGLRKQREALGNGYTYYTAEDVEVYKKSMSQYIAELDMTGTVTANAEMMRSGAMASPIINSADMVNYLTSKLIAKRRARLSNAIDLHYGQELFEAELMGSSIGQSFDGIAIGDGVQVSKQIHDMIRTLHGGTAPDSALNTFSSALEKFTDGALSGAIDSIRKAKTSDAALEAFQKTANGIAERYGAKYLFDNKILADMALTTKVSAPTRALVDKANNVMRTLVLRIDQMNAVVNAVGLPILMMPEIRQAMVGNPKYPTFKAMGKGMSSFMGNKELTQHYKNVGIIRDDVLELSTVYDTQQRMLAGDTPAKITEAAGMLTKSGQKIFKGLTKLNDMSELYTHGVAAHTAHELGLARGLKALSPEMDAFVGNFVAKVNVNYTGGQRPELFKGILGSAAGMFQSYAINYFQQMGRHLATDKKAALMQMGLQGMVFGVPSMPGFNLVNTAYAQYVNDGTGRDINSDFVTGVKALQMNGSPDKDFVTYGDLSDWIMYGSLSNLLGAGMWSRGDSNPRNVTLIPLNPADWASVNYYTNALGGLQKFYNLVSDGGNMPVSFLESLQHANISRPLSGLASIALGAKVTREGNIDAYTGNDKSLAAVDQINYGNVLRLLGVRPMQEAMASEATYKFGLVNAANQEKLKGLTQVVKTKLLSGEDFTKEDFDELGKEYTKLGGNIRGYRKWITRIMENSTQDAVERFGNAHKDAPFAQNYQRFTTGVTSIDDE